VLAMMLSPFFIMVIILAWFRGDVKAPHYFQNKKSPPQSGGVFFFVKEIFCTCGVYYHEFLALP
jgi:hypothetical protein